MAPAPNDERAEYLAALVRERRSVREDSPRVQAIEREIARVRGVRETATAEPPEHAVQPKPTRRTAR